ncbi:beta/alpha barrel domain-containing protein [Caldicellulosiruptor naganoensis]|uniref:Pyruvate carboxyltransferase n=1 Tax=Caldicellulosiruptor naganoensis TaxID=29324 RepID=A0ABY7BF36_9FIRM|nr:pyruvate carboxyltransferase [Caldicellulosiruptor naganoensis]WAM31429.1 pyruvate carboxyltransferase [Caldicellulosiruptor naganoensis]
MVDTVKKSFQDFEKGAPNYFKEIFPYESIPRVIFDSISVPLNIPSKLYVTDSTFREGQQAISYIGKENVAKIFEYLHYIDNGTGTIKYSEFFLYTNYHRQCVQECLKKRFKFPNVVGWVRSKKEELKLAKEFGLDEVGILMSCSDYHIYKKFQKTRSEIAAHYIDVIQEAFSLGITPRVHLEDITRSDIENFVIPLILAIEEMAKKCDKKVYFKLCDTLGFGVPYEYASLPRSVPKIIYTISKSTNIPPERLEWHGHNDFYKAQSNAVCAWLYGASMVNCSIRGIGERTGIAALEVAILDLVQIKAENAPNLNFEALDELLEFTSRFEVMK